MYIFLGLMVIWAIFEIVRGYHQAGKKNQYLTKTLLGAGTVILALFLLGPFFIISPIKLRYSTRSEGNLTLYYPSSHAARAEEIFAMAKQATEKNDTFYRPSSPTKILIATSSLDMLRFGIYPKGNGGGLAWGIVIRESKASWNIIAHEMSHKNLSKLSPLGTSIFSFPRWFDEGLASYIGSLDWYKKPPELKEDLLAGRYRRDITHWNGLTGELQWLNQTFFQHHSALIYGQTYLMVKYLFDTYGENRVSQLVQAIHQGKSFNKAFLQTFGFSPDEFHQQFIDFIETS